MKTNFLLVGFLLFLGVCSAQDNSQPEHKWSVGVQVNTPQRDIPSEFSYANNMQTVFINSPEYNLIGGGYSLSAKSKDRTFSVGLLAAHHLNEDNFVRFKVGINSVNIVMPADNLSDSLYDSFYNASKKRSDWLIDAGMGRSVELKKLNLFCGFSIPIYLYGKEQLNDYLEVRDAASGLFVNSSKNTASFANGFSFGVGTFAGFSFPIGRFSLGSEVDAALLFSKYGGAGITEHENKDASQALQTITTTRNPSLSLIEFSKPKASINLVFNF